MESRASMFLFLTFSMAKSHRSHSNSSILRRLRDENSGQTVVLIRWFHISYIDGVQFNMLHDVVIGYNVCRIETVRTSGLQIEFTRSVRFVDKDLQNLEVFNAEVTKRMS
jgi:hypothetical protein